MRLTPPLELPPSRRVFLALAAGLPALAEKIPAARLETFPSETKRYADQATEFTILRLTDPAHSSFLTSPNNRAISRNFLLYSSDRSGAMNVYRLDLKNAPTQRITDATELNPETVALVPGDRSCCYVDGGRLRITNLATLRDRDVYAADSGSGHITASVLSPDGMNAFVVERRDGGSSIRLVNLARGTASTFAESEGEISMPVPRPGGGVAYRCGAGMCWCDRSGNERLLPLAAGRTASAYWSLDGASLLYLNVPGRPGELNAIREYVLATGQDKLVAKTTQFVEFAMNADATVFAGASGSKASPHVLILVRSVRRELTICEHRARDPKTLALAFSPNSQRLVFQSDQHGKPALYSVVVDRFVEETES
jgi:oligogalacturonide lyase